MSHPAVCCLTAGLLLLCIIPYGHTDGLGGPAELTVKSIDQCPSPELYKYSIKVVRHKVNRTHEAFDAEANLGVPLDDNLGIYMHVAKKTGDVYKPNAYEFTDSKACDFFMKMLGQTYKDMLAMLEQPQSCPVKAGQYSVKNYLLDYRKLPSTLPYGDFRADVYFVLGEERVMCLQAFLSIKPKQLLAG